MNIVEKIITSHISGKSKSSSEVGLKIDQTLTQDATGTMAYLEFEAIGIESIRTELSVSYIDHNTLQDGFENADDHRYLQSIAEKYGLFFSKAGNGICHQVHLENFAVPGKTLLGSDSHTPTAGGIGSLAIGAGGLDIAAALAGSSFFIPEPKVIKINLEGKLAPFVSAKDIILHILSLLKTKGNVGCIIEYSGSALRYLTVPERATITNMGAELGVTTSIFPSDEVTLSFMKAQHREKDWTELKADPDAEYFKIIDIDLSVLKPLVALPHSPDNVKKVTEISGKKVDQVLIGSCTNSSYKDLYTVSRLLEGRKVSKDVSFGIAPGSKQVLQMIVNNGLLGSFINSGARLLEATCGFCIGMGQSPSSDSVSVRTNNRNFFGRSGTSSAGIFLVSPETAVASAVNGRITDPTEFFDIEIDYSPPADFINDDSLLIRPLAKSDRNKVSIVKGPNIGPPPVFDELNDSMRLKASIKVADNVTTDHIMPAGKYLKYRSNIEKYSEAVFVNLDPDFSERCSSNRESGYFNLIVAGESYGQGSSREHAAICPAYLGVKMVVSKTFERIHRANLINFGIIPFTFDDEKDYEDILEGDELFSDGLIDSVKNNRAVVLKNITRNHEYKLVSDFSERESEYLLAGGKLNKLKKDNKNK